jgi:Bacteriophage tail sheath protein
MPHISYRTPGVYVEKFDVNPQRIDLGRTDVAGFVGLAERGPVQEAIKVESYRQFFTRFGTPLSYGYLAYAVAGFFENGGRLCWVVRAADPSAARSARVRLLVTGRAPFVLEATSPGAWGNAITAQAIWGRDRVTHLDVRTPDGRAQSIDLDQIDATRPAGLDIFTNLLGLDDALLTEFTAEDIVRTAADNTTLPLEELSAQVRSARLSGGADGVQSLTINHFTGDPDREGAWGVDRLERVDGVSFVAVPDLMAGRDFSLGAGEFSGFGDAQLRDAQLALINSCMRRRDRIALLDMPPVGHDQILRYAQDWPQSSFAAFYHPWLVVDDPLRLRGNVRRVPPSGHVAGMYARTDRQRGVHKPPANEVLEGVFDVRQRIDDAAHGELNDRAVNAIRPIPGRGVLVLGARTLDPDIRWRYVNVRRLFAMIEEALDEQMQWVTFEPNNPRLWREIDRAVRGFLERLYRLGMLDGESSEKAYFVRCDDTTNPPYDTDVGRVRCVIGVQPPYPAEFVVVRIGVTRNGIEVQEKGAQDA